MTKTQILIPAAGQGLRFQAKGYVDPKPFIWSVKRQKRLIEIAVEDAHRALGDDAGEVFVILRAEHVKRGRDLLGDRATIIPIGALTTGAASTVQLAEPYLNRDAPVLVLNSDQTFKIPPERFAAERQRADASAVCLTFVSKKGESKWSYFDPRDGRIVEKPTKPPPGNIATVGAYWFRRAGEMLDAIRAMKAARFKINGEYYFAPCHNFLSVGGSAGVVVPVAVDKFAGLGTPEDLSVYEHSWEEPPERFSVALRAGKRLRTQEELQLHNRERQRKWMARRRIGFQPLPDESPYAGPIHASKGA